MSSCIDPSAKIGVNCRLGKNVVILEDVQVGDNVVIGHNVAIHPGTVIGEGTIISDGAVIGRQPRPSKMSTVKVTEPLPPLGVGPAATSARAWYYTRARESGPTP